MTTNGSTPPEDVCTGCGKWCPLSAPRCQRGFEVREAAGLPPLKNERTTRSRRPEDGEGSHEHDHGHGHGHGHGGRHHGGDHGHGRHRDGHGGHHHGDKPHGHHDHDGERSAHDHGRGRQPNPNLTEDERLARVFHHCARTLVHRERSQGGRASALAVLASHGAMTQAALAEKLDIRAASASELLTKMEADGLVDRTPSSDDGRAYRVELTEVGKAEAQQIQQERKARDAELFTVLTSEEKQQLTTLLDKLATTWRHRH